MNDILLDIRDLSKSYPGFRLDRAGLQVKQGSIHGLIGRNGAGKTTLLRTVLGFTPRDGGTVRVFSMDPEKDALRIRRRVGYAGAGSFYPRLPVRAHKDIVSRFYPEWDDGTWRELLERFSLDENKCPAEYSEGMKVKLQLALALSHGAELLILDEPTSGLDPVSRAELTELFCSLREKGTSILFSTHITSDLEKCADDLTYLKKGKVLYSGSKEELLGRCAARGQGSTLEEIMVFAEREDGNEGSAL